MFTGIVDAVGRVREAERRGTALELTIEAPYPDLSDGESVAVNGACLTVVESRNGAFTVQAVATTLERTRLAGLRAGHRVNLERALRVGDRLGGHLVQGHVDGVAKVLRVTRANDQRILDLQVGNAIAAQTVPLGSITVDGVSLTVNALPKPGVVRISLVPFTLEHTTLVDLKPGDRVHIEADLIGKYLTQTMDRRGRAGAGGAKTRKRRG